VPRTAAVIVVTLLVSAGLGSLAWALVQELSSLADELPRHKNQIIEKVSSLRSAGKGGTVEKLQKLVKEVDKETEHPESAARSPAKESGMGEPGEVGEPEPEPLPVVIRERQEGLASISSTPWIEHVGAFLGVSATVAIFVIFLLLSPAGATQSHHEVGGI